MKNLSQPDLLNIIGCTMQTMQTMQNQLKDYSENDIIIDNINNNQTTHNFIDYTIKQLNKIHNLMIDEV